jgi:hypothetical protein
MGRYGLLDWTNRHKRSNIAYFLCGRMPSPPNFLGNGTMSPQVSSLGKPANVPPSEVARFLHSKGHRYTPFKTWEFAAYFLLTAREAHDVLNDYAREGLLTFAGLENDTETWATSREGLTVFAQTPHRVTKKDLKAVKEAVPGIAALFDEGLDVELSLGGRPVFGKPNGRLIVGIRVAHEPFTLTEDAVLFSQVFEAISTTLRSHSCFSVLLFHEQVPERLKERLVMTGNAQGQTVTAPVDKVDREEVLQEVYLERFLAMCGHPGIEELRPYLWAGEYPNLSHHFQGHLCNNRDTDAPFACKLSRVKLGSSVPDPESSLDSEVLEKQRRALGSRRWMGKREVRQDEAMARVDYLAAAGRLEAYCDDPDPEHVGRLRGWTYLALGSDEQILRASLQVWYETIAAERARQSEMAARRPPPNIGYYAFFDCLNYARPHLVGFIRQPATNEASFDFLKTIWNYQLAKTSGTPGKFLRESGFSPAQLSLQSRSASTEERAAYDALCKREGKTFKAVFIIDGQCVVVRSRYAHELEDAGTSPVLATARLDGPLLPRLLNGPGWANHKGENLFDIVENAPREQRDVLRSQLVNIDSIAMADFVREACASPCEDRVVLATGLLGSWRFASSKLGWAASIGDDSWTTTLEAEGETLSLRVTIDGRTHTTRLAPSEARGRHRYEGRLSSFCSFMDRLQTIQQIGIERLWERNLENAGERSEENQDRLSWLAELVSDALTGLGWGRGFERMFPMDGDWASVLASAPTEVAP